MHGFGVLGFRGSGNWGWGRLRSDCAVLRAQVQSRAFVQLG